MNKLFLDPLSHRTTPVAACGMLCWFIALFALMGCMVFQSSAYGQSEDEPMTEAMWKQSFHGLRVVAEGCELKFNSLSEWMQQPPERRLLVVVGETDVLPIDVVDSLEQGVSVVLATENPSRELLGRLQIEIRPLQDAMRYPSNRYKGFDDTPVMFPSTFSTARRHPLFNDVDALVANRPGYFISTNDHFRRLLPLPPLRTRWPMLTAFVARLQRPGDRATLLMVGDSSLFNNQMLLIESNLSFVENVCRWMSTESTSGAARDQLLMIIDGQVQTAVDPSAITVLPPPPTRAEVMEALKNLPPEALLEFGNSVAQIAEDENMLNEFLRKMTSEISQKKINRAVLLAIFGLACLFGLATYFWQRKLFRRASSDISATREKQFSGRRSSAAAEERKLAASLLLNSVCLEAANRRLEDWPMFPQGLELGHQNEALAVLHEMTDANQALRSENAKYWSEDRLLELDTLVRRWKDFIRRQSSLNPQASG